MIPDQATAAGSVADTTDAIRTVALIRFDRFVGSSLARGGRIATPTTHWPPEANDLTALLRLFPDVKFEIT